MGLNFAKNKELAFVAGQIQKHYNEQSNVIYAGDCREIDTITTILICANNLSVSKSRRLLGRYFYF